MLPDSIADHVASSHIEQQKLDAEHLKKYANFWKQKIYIAMNRKTSHIYPQITPSIEEK